MRKVKFEDNLSYPREKEIIKFEGKEPFRLYFKMGKIFKDVLEVMGMDVKEVKLKWDATSINKSFYVKWEVIRKIDTWTKIKIELVAQGSQNSETREGNVTIAIVPVFITEVETGFLQRTFWWMYYFIYYKKKRIRDFYFAKNLINKLKITIGELYGIKLMESV